MHSPDNINRVFRSYLEDYGDGYDRTTFIQYIACVLFSDQKDEAVKALRQVAKNLAGLQLPPKEGCT